LKTVDKRGHTGHPTGVPGSNLPFGNGDCPSITALIGFSRPRPQISLTA
jgi:hypothetical protein